MNDFYQIEKNSDSEITIKIKIPADAFESSYKTLMNQRTGTLNLKGFRAGKVPQGMVEEKLKGEVLLETFERVAPYYVNAAIMKEALEPIAPPAYTDLQEIKLGQEVQFSVKVSTMPTFKLGDLKKIKLPEEDVKASEKEIEQTIETLKKSEFKSEAAKKMLKGKKKDDEKWAEAVGVEYNLPEVKDTKTLKQFVSKSIEAQKTNLLMQKQVAEAVKQAVELSKIEVPADAITYEAAQREEMFKNDLKKINVSIRDFCKRQNVTLEQLKTMWEKDAREALENDILFKIYANDRKIEVSDIELAAEVEKTKESARASAADPSKFNEDAYDDPHWQSHLRSFVLKQKAYEQFVKEVVNVVPHGDHFHKPGDHSHESEVKPAKKDSKKDSKKSKK